MKTNRTPSEADRFERYFAELERWMPHPTKAEMEQVLSRPCKWSKILEERKNNPDGTGEK